MFFGGLRNKAPFAVRTHQKGYDAWKCKRECPILLENGLPQYELLNYNKP